jgi:hypothetical protein
MQPRTAACRLHSRLENREDEVSMRTVIENIRTGARWSSVNGDVWRKDWNGTGDNYVQAGAVCPRFNPFSKRNAGKFRKVV